jgi:hypothetical protein
MPDNAGEPLQWQEMHWYVEPACFAVGSIEGSRSLGYSQQQYRRTKSTLDEPIRAGLQHLDLKRFAVNLFTLRMARQSLTEQGRKFNNYQKHSPHRPCNK